MMANSMGKRGAALQKMVKTRELSKREEDKKQDEVLVPNLPKDCMSNIIVRLPFSSLLNSRLVCKQWYNIIGSRFFIDTHQRHSESVLIFQTPLPKEKSTNFPMLPSSSSSSIERPPIFSVEDYCQPSFVPILWQPVPTKRFSLQFVEFEGGKCNKEEYNVICEGSIRAACNGLILLDSKLKKCKLIVLNPVTRKLIRLCLGTLSPPHNESYGFALDSDTGLYKVVHLFHDELGFVSCEVLDLENRIWRAVNGPAVGLLKWFGYKPVSAIKALHWVPQIDGNEYIVSMEVHTEKFHTINLPKICRAYDRIVEMSGFLGLAVHEEANQIDIWILKGIAGEEWRKHHSITVGCLWDMIPLFSLRINEEMIFWGEEGRSFYSYDFQLQVMKTVETKGGRFPLSDAYFPHVNSLVSWSSRDVQRFV